MRLVRVRPEPGWPSEVAVEVDGRVLTATQLGLDEPGALGTIVNVYFEGLHGEPLALLRSLADAAADRFATEGAPLHDLLLEGLAVGNIIAVGRNYHDHASEQNVAPPEVPLLFAKLSTSQIGSGETIEWDPAIATLVDYEAELGVIMGDIVSRVSPDEAMASVFGYCNVNDVTARDLQKSEGQWLRGKSHDTFCPVGPVVVTADEVPDPHALRITCTVNGEVRQDASTGDMIFSIPDLISHISQTVTLTPGDLICTGTPGGVGMHRTPQQLLADGDEVVVEVEGLGRLVNRCKTLS